MRRLLKIVFVVCILLAVAVGGLLWRLDRGPLSLAPLQPVLETLIARGSPYAVTFSQPSLVWLRDEGVIALETHDVEVRTPAGEFVASAPLMRATVAVRPLLLEQRLELVEAQLELPQLELTRNDDGKMVLSFAGQLAALGIGEATGGGGADALLGDDADARRDDPRLAALRLVRVTAPLLEFVDSRSGDRATATTAVFELERVGAAWRASLLGQLGSGSVEAVSEGRALAGQQQLTIEFKGLQAKDFSAFAPDLPLAGLAVPISGTVRLSADPVTAQIAGAIVDVTAGAGTIEAPGLGLAPIAIESALVQGRADGKARQAVIDQLQLVTTGFTLTGSGTVAQTDGDVVADVKVAAKQFDIAEILQLWPGVVAAGARAWVVANVPVGQISDATLQMGNRDTRPDQPDLGASFSFSGVQVRYLDTFPAATGLAGTASLAGGSLGFKLSAGRTGEVDLARGDVQLDNLMSDATSHLKVKVQLRSTVPAAMRLLDAEPIGLHKVTGLSADAAAGTQATKLELTLPLVDKIPPDKISYTAQVQLNDVALRDAAPGYSLAAASLPLTVSNTGLAASGGVSVNGVPLQVAWRENTPPVRGVKRTLKAAGRLDAAGAKALAATWPEQVRGAIGFDVNLVEARSPLRTVDVALDLREASVHLPEIVLSKQVGQPGTATARLVQPDARTLKVEQGRVEVAGWSSEGDAVVDLEPLQLDGLVLRHLQTPMGDLTVNLARAASGWRGGVDIGRLDLRPLMRAGDGGGGDGASVPDFNLLVSAQQLRLGDAPFSRLSGSIERRDGIWYAANLRANIEDSTVNVDLSTDRQQTAASVRSSDAGWLIRALAASDNGIRGGSFRLTADLRQIPSGGASGTGELKIRNFTLWGAPTIARIISLASFTGLGNALSGQGVPVDRLVVPFRLQGQQITLEQARLVGSNIGARADGLIDLANGRLDINGTVAPAYTVNRILGRIPIVGQILSGSGSDAALAATFSVRGPIGEPQIGVNPLSVLVPGMVRDLFSAMTADAPAESGGLDQR